MIVFYHSPCLDGLVAAWAVRQKYPDATLVPLSHGQRILNWIEGKDVMFVDICPCREDLERCIYAAETVTILDHHATAKANIDAWLADGMSSNFEFVYEPNKSGAGIAWDSFQGSETPPWIVRYVQDQDLWQKKLEHTEEVNAYLSFELNKSQSVETVDYILESGLEETILRGANILKDRKALIDSYVASAKLYTLPGLLEPVPGVECPRTVVSDVLNRLSVGHVLAFGWRENLGEGFAYSFRNSQDGIDLSSWVPKTFGTGGGHPHASGLVSSTLIHEEV